MMIRIQDLSKKYKSHGALRDLSLRVPEGSAFVVVGPNGAGKTTMIKILMNLLEATSGVAEVLGIDSRRLSPRELSQIGYVSENQELPGRLTVAEYLNYLRPFYSRWDKQLEAEVRAHVSGVERVEVQAMPLRTIFTSLARATRKLEG